MNDKMKTLDKIGDELLSASSQWNALMQNEKIMERHESDCKVPECDAPRQYRLFQRANTQAIIDTIDGVKADFEKFLAMVEAEDAGAKN